MPRKKTDKVEETKQEETPKVDTGKKVTASVRSAVKNTGFNLMARRKEIKEQNKSLLAKAGLADGFKSAAEIQRAQLPIPWLAMQAMLGRVGMPVNTIIEFLGQENTGKSTLVMRLLAYWATHNIPSYLINTEPKMLESDWISRLCSTDPELGPQIAECIDVSEQTYTLDEMDGKLRTWVRAQRIDNKIPNDVPLVVAIDSITKLMNAEEAAVLSTEKTKKDAVLGKGVADVSAKPGVTAKWTHEWVRLLNDTLNKYNVTVICVSGTNQNMNAGPNASFAPDGGASLNKTKTGGTAINQSACLQMTVTAKGIAKDTKNNAIGRLVRLRCVKNSYGPVFGDLTYQLKNKNFADSDGYQENPVDMDEAGANLLVVNKIFGFKVNQKEYTSEKLNLFQLTAKQVMDYLDEHEDIKVQVWKQLGITGYDTTATSVSETVGD